MKQLKLWRFGGGTTPKQSIQQNATATTVPTRGSIKLLFSKLQKNDLLLLLPALIGSIGAGIIPTLMAKIVGGAFELFTEFNPSNLPIAEISNEKKKDFFQSIIGVIWKFCGLSIGTMILSTFMISIWLIVGEKVAMYWRKEVYSKLDEKELTWYEIQDNHSIGAGGLMAKFSRESDEIRIAAGQTSGQMMESIATIVSGLILAFYNCWSLTFVVLSTIPIMMVLVNFVQKKATKWHMNDMESMAKVGKLVQQTVQSITTVKAFSLEKRQTYEIMINVGETVKAWNQLAFVYGGRLGVMAWMGLMMFATGFWYGGDLVQKGKATPGQVFTTFWACVIVGNSLGPMIQRLTFIELGKVASASLTNLCQDENEENRQKRRKKFFQAIQDEERERRKYSLNDDCLQGFDSTSPKKLNFDHLPDMKRKTLSFPTTPNTAKSIDSEIQHSRSRVFSTTSSRFANSHLPLSPSLALRPMKSIWPNKPCEGEIELQHVTFAYPSRPEELVLNDVSMFLPAKEITFILGGSGSGKSTISHLLVGLYGNDTNIGSILLDEQEFRFLDPIYIQNHIFSVDQNPIIFDLSIHENIALGLCGLNDGHGQNQFSQNGNHIPKLSRKRVIEACKMTLLDADIQKMENGYDTLLGAGGVDLSGGQKQRLALARALIRNPTILILDEATSALDLTNRTLVMALIRQCRKGKTTIIITHDWKQIELEDYVYMMEKGKIVEQGYRSYLEVLKGGKFAKQMIEQQNQDDDFMKIDCPSPTGMDWRASNAINKHQSSSFASLQQTYLQQHQQKLKHHRASRWAATSILFPVYGMEEYANQHQEEEAAEEKRAEIMSARRPVTIQPLSPSYQKTRKSLQNYSRPRSNENERLTHKHSSSSISSISSVSTLTGGTIGGINAKLRPLRLPQEQQIRNVLKEGTEKTLELSSVAVSVRRPDQPIRKEWSENELDAFTVRLGISEKEEDLDWDPEQVDKLGLVESKLNKNKNKEGWIYDDGEEEKTKDNQKPSATSASSMFFGALRVIWQTQPKKFVFCLGLTCTILGGCVQPAFSYIMGKLLATMATQDAQSTLTFYSVIVIGLAFADGSMQCLRFALLQVSANYWVKEIRSGILRNVLVQDKSWFDLSENQSSTLLTRIVKDPEDAKSFISRIIGEIFVVITMIVVVFVWSIIISWQLTLAGLALAPIFYIVISIQSKIMLFYEKQNKLQRERVAKRFFTMIQHVREIRSMSLHQVFKANYDDAVRWTTLNAIKAAPYSGFAFGLKDACIYASEAFLYYIGALLMIKGKIDLASMIIVFNLILFGVTFAAHYLAYIPNMTKSIKAIFDVKTLLELKFSSSSESIGQSQPPLLGSFAFHNVTFAYPQRPEELVLDNCTFSIKQGEKVALVGQSGCGKSTIASLLQRLYEPKDGVIVMDSQWPTSTISIHHLRTQLTLVSQQTDLFDDSIRNNLLMANPNLSESSIWLALEIACAAEFVRELEKGLDTFVGEKSNLISGGQKQRLAIARALVRQPSFWGGEAKIRILDECTSALDPENQEKVSKNLLNKSLSESLTTLIITHKLELMKACDRILVLQNGKVVQDGHYDQLIRQKGKPFSKLANAGEWGA